MMSATHVAAALLVVRALIAVIGFRRSTAAVCWLADRLPPPRHADLTGRALAEARARSIARIADRLPFRPRCLPRALLLAALLRRRRIGADLCLGARTDGAFDAHAWIEIDGWPVNEAADLRAAYSRLWRRSVLAA
jgi:hypothetical protein